MTHTYHQFNDDGSPKPTESINTSAYASEERENSVSIPDADDFYLLTKQKFYRRIKFLFDNFDPDASRIHVNFKYKTLEKYGIIKELEDLGYTVTDEEGATYIYIP